MDTIGRYRIVRELGRGGMGVVYEATDPNIGRSVAVKVILSLPHSSAHEYAELKLRFDREATAAGRLSHPNIVIVHDRADQDGVPYLVMEYIAGASLKDKLAPAVPLGLDAAIGILSQIAAALDHAHAQNIVHRDIKPANILVRPDGTVKLTDFGIAHISSETITRKGVTMGTTAYMSPEQLQAGKIDGRSDQFSLAVMAYEMLAARRPFVAPTDAALIFKIIAEEPRPLHEVNGRLPQTLSQVVSRALSKDPERRYRNCAEFIGELRTAARPAERLLSPGDQLGPYVILASLGAGGTGEVNRPRRAGATMVNPKDGLTYVWIPPGTFQMGSSPGDSECSEDEQPAHEVTIARGYWMGQTVVTQDAYVRVMGRNLSYFSGEQLPVENVNWKEAQEYCEAVGMRLPTEAEWEYAARAGTTGSRYGEIDRIAWYKGNSGKQTHPVAEKEPNAWGLYDMLGNIWEWVSDWRANYQAGSQRDPAGPASGEYRVLRGGSFYDYPPSVRAPCRSRLAPELRHGVIGLRCASDRFPGEGG
jgi:formylglycine-generating enzyme required for sulfatase activity